MEQEQSRFEGWAVVEMFGHVKEIGYVTTQHYGVACLFQIDTPELPEREFVLKNPEYACEGNENLRRWCPAGTKVKRPASLAKSRFVGPGAIYSMTPCTQETAMRAIEEFTRRPLMLLELPVGTPKELPAPDDDDLDDEDEYLRDLETQSDRGV